jgi:hypothetical protein
MEGSMTNRLGGALLAAILIAGAFFAWRHPVTQLTLPSETLHVVPGQPAESEAATPNVSPQNAGAPSLWVRPRPEVAARHYRRSGMAWVLRQLGASERFLDQMTGGDLVVALNQLKAQAKAGDPAAINVLGWIAHQDCRLGRTSEVLDQYEAWQTANAKALAPVDADWFAAAVHADVAFDKELNLACQQVIDVDQAMELVEARAKQGDAASLWILSRSSDPNTPDPDRQLRDAALAGFAQAQFEYTIRPASARDSAGNDPALVTGDLLRQSADRLPIAEGALAYCEYYGCGGMMIDVASAIEHARDAAQRGSMDSLIDIAPHLQESQIDPDAASAWTVIRASLQQQGCGSNGFRVDWLQQNAATLTSNRITPQVRALAEQYWQAYGAQIRSGLGCGY